MQEHGTTQVAVVGLPGGAQKLFQSLWQMQFSGKKSSGVGRQFPTIPLLREV